MKKALSVIAAAILLFMLSSPVFAGGSAVITVTVPSEHTVTVICGEGGKATAAGGEFSGIKSFTAARLTDFALTAIPDEGYELKSITGDGENGSEQDGSSYTQKMICGDTKIEIIFRKAITLKTTGDGSLAIAVGGSISLSVDAEGAEDAVYVWEISSDGGKTWITPRGAENSPTYEIIEAQANPDDPTQPYMLRVTVTDGDGRTASQTTEVLVSDDYSLCTVLNSTEEIAVTGYLQKGANIVVTPLKPAASELAELTNRLSEGNAPIILCDISLVDGSGATASYFGSLDIGFNVGKSYNGQALTVLHKFGDEIEALTGNVENGILTVTVNSLSPFVVEAPESTAYTVLIRTGDGGSAVFPSGRVRISKGDSSVLYVSPDNGGYIDSVKVNGVEISGKDGVYTVTGGGEMTIEVSFGHDNSLIWLIFLPAVLIIIVIIAVIVRRRLKKKDQSS